MLGIASEAGLEINWQCGSVEPVLALVDGAHASITRMAVDSSTKYFIALQVLLLHVPQAMLPQYPGNVSLQFPRSGSSCISNERRILFRERIQVCTWHIGIFRILCALSILWHTVVKCLCEIWH